MNSTADVLCIVFQFNINYKYIKTLPNETNSLYLQCCYTYIENGGVVYSKEVTIELEGVTNRFDFVGKQDNLLYLYEVKNGPSARMTINQRIIIPKMQQYKPSFWPKGKNALKIPEFRFSIINNQPYGGDYIVIYKHYID